MSRCRTAALGAALLLTGCTAAVSGTPTPAVPRSDVPPADFPVGLAGDTEVDRLARNALADVVTYWQETLPEVYGQEYTDLAGGYWSIDPATTRDADLPPGSCVDVDYVARTSALYCSDGDVVLYNAASLADSAAVVGPLVIGSTMAHEVGHAVQHRVGTSDRESSLVLETQAECFAGSWSRWVADGGGAHARVREPELDRYLEGYAYFADPVGASPDDPGAHGSAFDQLAAFQVGWDGGAAACRDEFTADRVFTVAEYTSADDEDAGGDLPLAEALPLAGTLLASFWSAVTAGGLAAPPDWTGDVRLPEVREGPAGCAGTGDPLLTWCADGGDGGPAVVVDVAGALAPAVRARGDYAVVALVALPYALAVADGLGQPTDGPGPLATAACSAGWLTAAVHAGELPGTEVRLSPGDVDEAVLALLDAAGDARLVEATALSAFDLTDAFRRGFEGGGSACLP
ncbi:neutral zinc metallopeptidase [Blastococcus sp. SYSU D00820]